MVVHETLFVPEEATVIVKADGEGSGFWVGAPSVTYVNGSYYLYYRRRGPRPERGNLCYILRNDGKPQDAEGWKVIWQGKKEDLTVEGVEGHSPSFEKSALVYFENVKLWRLYISYVDPKDQRWRIDVLESADPAQFSFKQRREVLTAASSGTEGVKDPEVIKLSENKYRMYFSYAPIPDKPVSYEAMHGTSDILNTGTSKSVTGYIDSDDNGATFKLQTPLPFQQISLEPAKDPNAWDAYAARLTTVWPSASEKEVYGLYDGAQTVAGNYEERTGLAVSRDGGIHFHRETTEKPILISKFQSGALRYAQRLVVNKSVFWFFEAVNSNGAHDLYVVENH